jgi:hypothetical protein
MEEKIDHKEERANEKEERKEGPISMEGRKEGHIKWEEGRTY